MARSKFVIIPLLTAVLGLLAAAQATPLVSANLVMWQNPSAMRQAADSSLLNLCACWDLDLKTIFKLGGEVGNYLQITMPTDATALGLAVEGAITQVQGLLSEAGGGITTREADEIAPLVYVGTGLLLIGIIHPRKRDRGAD